MPNICSNTLKLIGTPLQLTDFRTRFLSLDESDNYDFSFESIAPTPDDVDREWYDDNWGTSWDAMDVEVTFNNNRIVIVFGTAWSPPLEVVEKLSQLMPELHIKIMYEEPNENFCGHVYYHGGIAVVSDQQDYQQAESDEEASDFEEEDPVNPFQSDFEDDDLIIIQDVRRQPKAPTESPIYLKRVKTLNRYSRKTLIRYLRLHGLKFHVGMGKSAILKVIQPHFTKLLLSLMKCPICIDTLAIPVQPKCKHVFCRKCIDQWKATTAGATKCPICRQVV